jgi:hypothetical protein
MHIHPLKPAVPSAIYNYLPYHPANFKKQILKIGEIYIHAPILIALDRAFSTGMFASI